MGTWELFDGFIWAGAVRAWREGPHPSMKLTDGAPAFGLAGGDAWATEVVAVCGIPRHESSANRPFTTARPGNRYEASAGIWRSRLGQQRRSLVGVSSCRHSMVCRLAL